MLTRALSVLVLATPLAAQATWTVDDDGPADFASLQDAIDAAAGGDTVIVRAGSYSQAVIDGKGLTIQGDGPVLLMAALAPVHTLEIKNLAAGEAVYVRGLELDALGAAEVTTLVVAACAGPVLLEDCLVNGVGIPAAVSGSASVTFSRCDLIAPQTFASIVPFFFLGFVPYQGLAASGSNVFLYGCEVRGSSGGDAHSEVFVGTIPPGTSAPGMTLSGGTLLASGCTLAGGSGGGAASPFCFPGADGSPGLELSGGTARLLDCTVLGGAGGTGSCGNPSGASAPAVEGGAAVDLPGAARAFSGDSPVVEGTSTTVHLAGEPGDAVILHVQVAAAPGTFFPDYGCALHLPLPTAVVGLGVLPPTGVLDLAFPVPPLAPGVESFRALGQALFVGASGFFEGGPSTLLIVDAAL